MPGPHPIAARPTVLPAMMTAQGFNLMARQGEVVVLRAADQRIGAACRASGAGRRWWGKLQGPASNRASRRCC